MPHQQELGQRRLRPQMCVSPRKLKVSGLPSPRRARFPAAKRPTDASSPDASSAQTLRKSQSHVVPEALCIGFVLEADDDIVA
jgi:hypothetical protein